MLQPTGTEVDFGDVLIVIDVPNVVFMYFKYPFVVYFKRPQWVMGTL